MRYRSFLLALFALALMALPAVAGGSAAAPEARSAGGGGFGYPDSTTECSRFNRDRVAGDKKAVSPRAPNPLAGETWYTDLKRSQFTAAPGAPRSFREPALAEWARSSGKTRDLFAKIAFEPRFFWYGAFSGDNLSELKLRVCTYLADAERVNEVPLITTLRHLGKQCTPRYQAGGKREDRAFLKWMRAFAQAVGRSRAVIAYEPDSVGTVNCLARSRRDDRIRTLRKGINILSKLPNATIYIEATASDWESVGRVAKKLRRIGVAKVRGFMLNVTHFDWTKNNIRYGTRLSRKLGGKHFIVNTASNGRGPVHFRRRQGGRNRRIVINCHPLFRGIGPKPTTRTGSSRADAFMWISRPGYSSGSCNGGPRVGNWWRKRALQMAKLGTTRKSPKKGTRFGFPRGKYTPRQVSGTQFKDDKFDTSFGQAF